MKELRISYRNENCDTIFAEYESVNDFINLMESDEIDIPMLDYSDVDAVFIENSLNKMHFDSIECLLEYCKVKVSI